MNKYKRPLKFVWNSFKGNKGVFYLFFTGKILEGIFYVIFPILAKLEMDQLVEKNKQLFGIIELDSFNIFLVILTIIFGFKLIENFLKSFISLFEHDYIKMYDNAYSETLYERLQNVDPGIFLNSRNKRFIGEILGYGSKIGDNIRRFIGDFITNIFVIIGIVTVLTLINPWIFVILILSSIIIYSVEKLKKKFQEKEDFEDKYEYDEKLWILTEQMRKNLSYLMASGGFELVLSYYKKNNTQIRERIKISQKKIVGLNIISFIVENISEILVKLLVGYGVFYSTTSVGTMTLVLLYIERINTLFDFFRNFKFASNDLIDDLLYLDLFLDLTEIKKEKNISLNEINTINFKNLSFFYPNFAKHELRYLDIVENRIKSYSKESEWNKDELHMIAESRKDLKEENPLILDKINFELKLGNTYGIVGKNGAGKTTLISLLLNYFDDYTGNIIINNEELKNFERDFFVKNISVINQIPYIIEGFTIKENLLLGVKEKYNNDYIMGLVSKFGLENKILKNRLGLDARIGYDNDFSGGEKQLIALIRVILQNKKILIMDEGTNQLDAENEILIMNELLKNKADKIVIFITHRMTTIRKVDLIYCLEDGTITDSGTHNELIKNNNIYSKFWKKQVEE